MAKARDLAALAGLAGLAYAMRNKDEAPKGKADTGPGYKSTETREKSAGDKAVDDTKSSVLTALQKPKNIREEGIAEANDVRTATSASSPKPASNPKPELQSFTTRKDPRDLEAGMSRGTRKTSIAGAGRGVVNPSSVTPKPVSTVSSSEEGMEGYKPRRSVPPLLPTGMKKGGMASSASKRADGIASRGKTRCKMY
jgi:hypothetical protein